MIFQQSCVFCWKSKVPGTALTWASWLSLPRSNVDTHHRHSLLSPEGAGSRLRARTRAIVSPNHPGIISGKFIFRQKSWKFWKISKKVKNQAFFNNPEISSKCLICAAPRLAHGIRARNLARTSRGIAKRPKPSRETSYASLWWSYGIRKPLGTIRSTLKSNSADFAKRVFFMNIFKFS